MTDFAIHFSHPWLLLLIVPALFLALFPYFRLAKRYRRNRNRITSLVLHSVVMVLATLVLSGMYFTYETPNDKNEVLLLVDMSFSSEKTEDDVDSFILSALEEGDGNFRMGIVTFGFDQVYASPLSNETSDSYGKYKRARLPDNSATDIASALNYARSLLSRPRTAKIVLISDGVETDGSALAAIAAITADGVKVDTVNFSSAKDGNEVQIVNVITPDYNIVVGDSFDVQVVLQSSFSGGVTLNMFEDDQQVATRTLALNVGMQAVVMSHSFEKAGLHKLYFEVTTGLDTLEVNNKYCAYINLVAYDKLLVLERADGESKNLCDALAKKYDSVSVLNINDAEKLPATVEALREYDQIVLYNIGNEDLPIEFDIKLQKYVRDFGGSMLTVGGDRVESGNVISNVYNRYDMIGTVYQDMLPVQAVKYTPPLGVVIIIDRSGSMSGGPLDAAKKGAISCVDGVLTERDWCGIMTLESDYREDLTLTPMTQKPKILEAIDDIQIGGGTNYTGAINRAGKALSTLKSVEKRHIILVTDGQPGDSFEDYSVPIKHYYDTFGITLSMVIVGDASTDGRLKEATEQLGHGKFYNIVNGSVPSTMRDDLNVPEIKEVEEAPYKPTIRDYNAVVNGITQQQIDDAGPTLNGYYGTKLKTGAEAPLMSGLAPLYASWKYGEGHVGSFMCDLGGKWSGDFLTNELGIKLLCNMINILLPTRDIRVRDVETRVIEDNYSTQISIYTKLEKGQVIDITVTSPPKEQGDEPTVRVIRTDATKNFSRITIKNVESGIHEIVVEKKAANGQVLASCVAYRAFSYSREYDWFANLDDGKLLLEQIAKNGRGKVVTESSEIFNQAQRTLPQSADPRIAFIIIAALLFLLDIAVRKFKWKWPHEIIRERRAEKRERMSK